MRKTKLPPGPRFSPMQGMRWLRDPIDLQERLQARYGDIFSVPLPLAGRLVVVGDPDTIKFLFTGDPGGTRFYTGEANAIPIGPLVGDHSMLTQEEQNHAEKRKRLVPLFHGRGLVERWSEVITEVVDREIDSWPVHTPFRLQDSMQGLSLEVLLRTVMGVRDPTRIARFRELIAEMGRVIPNMLLWTPALRFGKGRWSPWGRFLRSLAAVDKWFYEEIRLRRAQQDAEPADDMLSLLLAVRDEDGAPLTDVELRDELMTMMVAGHHTVQSGLCWLFERVLRHPEVEERLRADVESGSTEYVEATIKETLRVRPVLPSVPRVLQEETPIGDWLIPPDTIVLIAIALAHRRPDTYPEPDAFRPERFLEGSPDPYTWIPWGGGVRRCLGANFAMLEMTQSVTRIFQRTRLRVPDPEPEAVRMMSVTIGPARGATVVMDERPLPAEHERARAVAPAA